MEWCVNCYMQHPREKLPSKVEVDDSKEMVVDNENMHHWGRPGNYFLTHFQYEVCHFSNVQVRNLISNRLEDDRLLCAIWRDCLDGYIGQRPGTVKKFNDVETDA